MAYYVSSAGTTIKRLKGDIVEALECLLHQDLIFHEVVITVEVEKELEGEDSYSAVEERMLFLGLRHFHGINWLRMVLVVQAQV